ncbi:hypothetical protein GDO86_008069 [Hymenochirus boettgeri]|uniref:Uncharacterized protein n=1 Tax=Hymenochirus boettgeri TaxID=247094 RepID=A0A8T2IWA0_9PIPI|nr:hypothetical protein GDO86_008069 [Hymenochirus boettgeri]
MERIFLCDCSRYAINSIVHCGLLSTVITFMKKTRNKALEVWLVTFLWIHWTRVHFNYGKFNNSVECSIKRLEWYILLSAKVNYAKSHIHTTCIELYGERCRKPVLFVHRYTEQKKKHKRNFFFSVLLI